MSIYKIQRIIAVSLAVLTFLTMYPANTLSVYADEEIDRQSTNGYVHIEKEIGIVPELRAKRKAAGEAFDPYYRSDEQEWAAGIRVKDQGKSGLCWAFSMTSAAEYSYAKEYYESTGAVREMSPGHFGYFYYNRVNDPLGNTAGDQNISSNWTNDGGNQMNGMFHMATWSGMRLEETCPFDLVNDNISNSGRWNKRAIPYSDDLAYNDTVRNDYASIQEAEVRYDPSVDEIKEMIMKYGAVTTAVWFDTNNFMNLEETDDNDEYYPDGRSFYNYNSDYYMPNHAVTIVGWDDNYPKENFTHTNQISYQKSIGKIGYSGDSAAKLTTPENDGAWIVQNSWGTDTNDNGFFYASYESCDLTDPRTEFSAYDMQPADTYRYNFQYDGSGDTGDASDPGNESIMTNAGTRAANVFTNTTGKAVDLEAVCFGTFTAGRSDYDIKVYTGLTDSSDPLSGKLAGGCTASTDTIGVKTVRLDAPVLISPGEKFSIVFTFKNANHFCVEYKRPGFDVKVSRGQSFFSTANSSAWTDLYDHKNKKYGSSGACFRIKGLANIADISALQKDYNKKVAAAKSIKAKIKSVTPKKGRKAVVKWYRRTKATGYQIYYSTDKNFKKSVKKLNIGKNSTLKTTLKNLKAGKTYYVKIRTYNTIKNKATGQTKNTCGVWSAKRKFKAKK